MAHISILGSGNMGQAIAGLAGKGGHTVDLLNSSDGDKPVTGDIVVLAVPYGAGPRSSRSAAGSWPARSSWTSPTR
jgi:predicted dinucleotide-binding enzyme